MIIGLTGGSGSGKSTVAELFQKMDIQVIDCDKIGHEILMPGGCAEREVVECFGEEILDRGVISRKKLGAIVFSYPEKLEELNRITHKHIRAEILRRLEGLSRAVVDGALLFESGMDDLCDKMIVVTCPIDERLRRIMERDGISREAAEKRISAQSDEKLLTKRADAVIINDGAQETLAAQIDGILKSW